MERARILRAIVQKDPLVAKPLKTNEQEAVAPRPGSGGVARRTREHGGPGRGPDGTGDTPAAESEPPEDRAIHQAKSPTPAPEMLTRACYRAARRGFSLARPRPYTGPGGYSCGNPRSAPGRGVGLGRQNGWGPVFFGAPSAT